MKELFESLWAVAPRLMSVIFIFVFMIFICLRVTQFYLEIEDMKVRLVRVEQKVDMIIEYLLRDQAERKAQQNPTGGK